MSAPPDKPESNFLRRWSQRKHAAAREAEASAAARPAPVAPVPQDASPSAAALPVAADTTAADAAAQAKLPDVASLSFDSDFRPFLSPNVDEGTRRAALRKLFADPHFNTMDGLDVYIDDYNKFEPMTPEIVEQLAHARYLFDPPQTRVNAQGHVEDVVDATPPAERVAEGDGDVSATAGTTAPSAASDVLEADAGAADAPSSVPAPAVPDATKSPR